MSRPLAPAQYLWVGSRKSQGVRSALTQRGRPKICGMKNIVILISGGGSNMAAIVKAAQRDAWEDKYQARVAAVISNRADAGGLAFAREHAIPTAVLSHQDFAQHAQPREAFDAALQTLIDPYQPFLVVLAGFMRILTPGFVQHYDQRLLNIHPSLLPAFAGLHTHEHMHTYIDT